MIDLGGVVFRWQPLVLLQALFPTWAPNETEANKWASAIFQTHHPEGYWALFDLGLIEPEPLAQRIAQRTGLAASDLRHLIANIPPHLWTTQGMVNLIHDLKAQGHRLYFLSNMPAGYADHLVRENDFFRCLKKVFFRTCAVNQTAGQARGSLQGTPVLLMMFSTTSMPQLHMAGNRIGLKRPSKCGLRWSD